MDTIEELKRFPDATTRPRLLAQIQEALKNRQHVELIGDQFPVKKLLEELIVFRDGKSVIPARHDEDFSIQVIENVAFPVSDKMTIEHLMRQLLQEFGWPPVSNSGFVRFYFGRLMKELTYDRVVPVILLDHPEVMRDKGYKILQIISEYSVDRKSVGVPTLVINNSRFGEYTPLGASAFVVQLRGGVTSAEVLGLIEEVAPGMSTRFDPRALDWLHSLYTPEQMKAKAKELIVYMQTLGVESVNDELITVWTEERRSKRVHAKKNA